MLDNELKLLFIPVGVVFLAIIISTSGINLLFYGLLSVLFFISLEKRFFLLLLFIVFANMVLEVIYNIDIFVLSISSLVIYLFFYKKIVYLISNKIMQYFLLISMFYTIIFTYLCFIKNYDVDVFAIILKNILFDVAMSSLLL